MNQLSTKIRMKLIFWREVMKCQIAVTKMTPIAYTTIKLHPLISELSKRPIT